MCYLSRSHDYMLQSFRASDNVVILVILLLFNRTFKILVYTITLRLLVNMVYNIIVNDVFICDAAVL